MKHRITDIPPPEEHSYAKEIYSYYRTGPLKKGILRNSPIRTFRELY